MLAASCGYPSHACCPLNLAVLDACWPLLVSAHGCCTFKLAVPLILPHDTVPCCLLPPAAIHLMLAGPCCYALILAGPCCCSVLCLLRTLCCYPLHVPCCPPLMLLFPAAVSVPVLAITNLPALPVNCWL